MTRRGWIVVLFTVKALPPLNPCRPATVCAEIPAPTIVAVANSQLPRGAGFAAARLDAWSALTERVPRGLLDTVAEEVDLAGAIPVAHRLLGNEITGRVVVDVRR
jgi:hypothetical protein